MKFPHIKVDFSDEAYEGGFETCHQKIASHHPKWDFSFLDDEELLEALVLKATEELPSDTTLAEVQTKIIVEAPIEVPVDALQVGLPLPVADMPSSSIEVPTPREPVLVFATTTSAVKVTEAP